MDVSQLAGMVSVGTLLAFTMVAISILILRYVPPNEMPLPSSFQESIESLSFHEEFPKGPVGISDKRNKQSGQDDGTSKDFPLIIKNTDEGNY
ncbi:cationic amino acid transporter 2, vacuolar-like, partial [Dendrobium catenatum]|uniref:cationic amino acid transporter 2, vacuolar-like n=1 Tax=Dendrobium catenatum TaxID=906689 RepID=UPI00109FD433